MSTPSKTATPSTPPSWWGFSWPFGASILHTILPVIHFRDPATTLEQAAIAFAAGADGVFLIHHAGHDDALFAPARNIKDKHPTKLIGVNLLGHSALEALHRATAAGLDMVWADAPGVHSAEVTEEAHEIARCLHERTAGPQFFGSVAFKYQPHEPDPGLAAIKAALCNMIPTTSGLGTGTPPPLLKAVQMRAPLPGYPLAVASGMTPENVRDYLPYFTHYLVATGVSRDSYHFDPARLAEFVRVVRMHP